MATTSILEKAVIATDYARKVSENGMVFVYERDGVYWLATRVHDSGGYHTLRAVGIEMTGIRRIKKDIADYFEAK